jgi:hypothetical protein
MRRASSTSRAFQLTSRLERAANFFRALRRSAGLSNLACSYLQISSSASSSGTTSLANPQVHAIDSFLVALALIRLSPQTYRDGFKTCQRQQPNSCYDLSPRPLAGSTT